MAVAMASSNLKYITIGPSSLIMRHEQLKTKYLRGRGRQSRYINDRMTDNSCPRRRTIDDIEESENVNWIFSFRYLTVYMYNTFRCA